MATGTIKNSFELDCGYADVAVSGAAGTFDTMITFNTEFSSLPIVVASINDVARGTGESVKTGVGVQEVSRRACRLRVKTEAIMSGNVRIYWIAMSK